MQTRIQCTSLWPFCDHFYLNVLVIFFQELRRDQWEHHCKAGWELELFYSLSSSLLYLVLIIIMLLSSSSLCSCPHHHYALVLIIVMLLSSSFFCSCPHQCCGSASVIMRIRIQDPKNVHMDPDPRGEKL